MLQSFRPTSPQLLCRQIGEHQDVCVHRKWNRWVFLQCFIIKGWKYSRRTCDLPKQEVFLTRAAGTETFEVIKTYDTSYAREVFGSLDDGAMRDLAAALDIVDNYDSNDIPDASTGEYEEFVWEELLDSAIEDVRLDPNLRSFFVVTRRSEGQSHDLYISPDWPSAEAFVNKRLTVGS